MKNYPDKEIQKKYPGHFILGEESSFEQAGTNKIELFERCKKEPFSWIIDPLDGTNNYLNRLPFYAVCIALAVKGNPVMGVVYVPSTGEMYEAVKGGGAFFRKAPGERRQRMTCKGFKKDLGQCILATGFSSEKGKVFDKEFTIFKKMLENTRGIRRFGSAALDMCWSARGIIDGFWEKGLAPWDMAAPGIICKEAGLVLSDFSGGKFDPFVPNVIAAPRRIQTKLTKILG